MFSPQQWLIGAAVMVLLSGGVYFKGRLDGSQACDARHASAQVEHEKKVRSIDAKIKTAAPSDADKPAAIKWLREHVRK